MSIVVRVELGSGLSVARLQVCLEDVMQRSHASAEHIATVVLGLSSGVKMDTRMTNQRNTRDAVFEQAYSKYPSPFF